MANQAMQSGCALQSNVDRGATSTARGVAHLGQSFQGEFSLVAFIRGTPWCRLPTFADKTHGKVSANHKGMALPDRP
jgi:hypothetical protein